MTSPTEFQRCDCEASRLVMEAWFLERGTEKNQDDGGHRDTLYMRVHVEGVVGWLLVKSLLCEP